MVIMATNEKNDINLAESKYQIPGGDYVKVRAIPRFIELQTCLLYTSPSPRDRTRSRMPSSA